MGNSISVTTDESKADKYAANCVLALPLVDSSDLSGNLNCTTTSKATTVTNATHSNLSNFYSGSFDFDGTDDEISIASSSDFAFGTGDFTIEMWAYTDAWPATFWDTGAVNSNNNCCIFAGASYLYWYMKPGTDLGVQHVNSGLQIGRWNHLAFVRSGSTTKIYLNGQEIDSETNASDVTTETAKIGTLTGYSYDTNGQIQDVRVYKGVAKYTENFIPASNDPDILPDSPSGVASKSKLTEITEGSVSFDGTGDYLATYTSSSELSFGTGDFTIEMFLYNEETGGKGFIQISDSEGGLKNSNSGTVTIHKDAGQSGVFRAYVNGGSTGFTSKVPYKRWCHVALVLQSGTIKLFVDGKQDATTVTSDTTNYATTYVVIGGYYDTNYLSKCTISNVRVNKGTAVYTRDFKPPTRQLTNISGTKLLCCHSNSQPGAGITAPNMGGVNSGVQWSAGAGPNFEANNPARDGFNGKENSNTRTDNADVTATINFPVPVAFSSTLKVRGARDSGNGKIILIGGNGEVDVSSQFTSSSASLETVTITGVTSPLKGISLIGISGSAQPRFSAIYIDDVMLLDPLTPYGDVSVSSNAEEKVQQLPSTHSTLI